MCFAKTKTTHLNLCFYNFLLTSVTDLVYLQTIPNFKILAFRVTWRELLISNIPS